MLTGTTPVLRVPCGSAGRSAILTGQIDEPIVSEVISRTVDHQAERQELAAVLASDAFRRAPVQAQLLSYLCAKYFEGTADQLKEYTIALEALGRPPHFDHKKDSIVRVEIHGLRKRLREYYAAEGVGHALQIQIRPGQYVPAFVSTQEVGKSAEQPPKTWATRRVLRTIALALVVVAGAALFLTNWFAGKRGDRRRTSSAALAPASALNGIRIRCGAESGDYIDSFGRFWGPDRFFSGGTLQGEYHRITGTHDQTLYQQWRAGAFRYDIPLEPGVYEMRLHFAEMFWGEGNVAGGGETSRLFDIWVNDRAVLSNFDVIREAGASNALIVVLKDISPAQDGKLHLRFVPVNDLPFLNGIEITPGVRGRLRPIRLVARDGPYADKNGRYWLPDRYSVGGQLVSRGPGISNTSVPDLYSSERFGNFRYQIPVAPGKYLLTLYFAERWFGAGKLARGGTGSRVFDVLCNGVALLEHFDIHREAGGPDRALTVTFRNVEPNAQGQIAIAFVPEINYAAVNALELTDEADGS